MAILSCTEEWRGLSGQVSLNEVRYTRLFRVVFNNQDEPELRPLMAADNIVEANGNPIRMWSSHPYNSWLVVVDVQVRLSSPPGPMTFDVEVTYSNKPSYCTIEAAGVYINPCDQPWDVEWFTEYLSDRVDEDIYGYPIVNANKEPPDPPLQEDVKVLGLRIRRAQADWNHALMSQYANAVNNDWFLGYAPGIVLCKEIGARRMRQGYFFFWDASFVFLFNPLGWKRKVRHEGMRMKVYNWTTSKFDIVEATDDNGDKVSQPVLLDAEGIKLEKGQTATWLNFETKRYMNFSALGIY